MSDFGELRSLVMGPCDVLAWEKICALLDAFRPDMAAILAAAGERPAA